MKKNKGAEKKSVQAVDKQNLSTVKEVEKEKNSSNIDKPIEIKKKLSSVSIKDTLNKVSEEIKEEKKSISSTSTKSLEIQNENFDLVKLKDALALFVKIKRFHERVRCVLLSHEPEIINKTIILGIDNVIQESDFKKLKPMVLSFLKKELKNDTIDLKAIVLKLGSSKKTYTDTEKFNSLCKKNPVLRMLKEKLSLDFE